MSKKKLRKAKEKKRLQLGIGKILRAEATGVSFDAATDADAPAVRSQTSALVAGDSRVGDENHISNGNNQSSLTSLPNGAVADSKQTNSPGKNSAPNAKRVTIDELLNDLTPEKPTALTEKLYKLYTLEDWPQLAAESEVLLADPKNSSTANTVARLYWQLSCLRQNLLRNSFILSALSGILEDLAPHEIAELEHPQEARMLLHDFALSLLRNKHAELEYDWLLAWQETDQLQAGEYMQVYALAYLQDLKAVELTKPAGSDYGNFVEAVSKHLPAEESPTVRSDSGQQGPVVREILASKSDTLANDCLSSDSVNQRQADIALPNKESKPAKQRKLQFLIPVVGLLILFGTLFFDWGDTKTDLFDLDAQLAMSGRDAQRVTEQDADKSTEVFVPKLDQDSSQISRASKGFEPDFSAKEGNADKTPSAFDDLYDELLQEQKEDDINSTIAAQTDTNPEPKNSAKSAQPAIAKTTVIDTSGPVADPALIAAIQKPAAMQSVPQTAAPAQRTDSIAQSGSAGPERRQSIVGGQRVSGYPDSGINADQRADPVSAGFAVGKYITLKRPTRMFYNNYADSGVMQELARDTSVRILEIDADYLKVAIESGRWGYLRQSDI